MSVGFADVRKFYYLPSVHQPTGIMELIISKKKWDALPPDLKAIVENACQAKALKFTLMMVDQNSKDLMTLVEKKGVKLMEIPARDHERDPGGLGQGGREVREGEPLLRQSVRVPEGSGPSGSCPTGAVAHPPYDLAADHYWGKANPYKVQKP